MCSKIAGIDVHKRMLAVVVADVEIDGDFHFERQKVGTTPADLRGLADWLSQSDLDVDRALNLDPRDVDSWTAKGVVLGRLKRATEQLAAYDRAIQLDPLSSLYEPSA